MSRNKDSKPFQASPLKGKQQPANASPEQLSEDQLDKVVGGGTFLGATMAGAAAGSAVGAAGGAPKRTGGGGPLVKSIIDTINSAIGPR
jgi:hypothetical protein